MKDQDIVSTLLNTDPYALTHKKKLNLLLPRLYDLTHRHYMQSTVYQNIIDRVYGGKNALSIKSIEDIPFLPISLFKTQKLCSVPSEEVIKVLTSSGTTGQAVSKVYLDRDTAQLQSSVLVKIVQHFLGKARLPMVIIDHQNVIHNRQSYSARGAAILGMLQFGRRPFYALQEEQMSLNLDGLETYLNASPPHTKLFFFGFTSLVWQNFICILEKRGIRLNLKNAILIHGGGWKKLHDMAVSPEEFRERLEAVAGIRDCLNFYGMVEQVGSVYFENPYHHLHVPIYSDVIIRHPTTLEPLPPGKTGLIQVLSALPTSYPGHSILTEDLGVLRGVDSPSLEMKGKYFDVLGRVPKADLRGCSDTLELMKGA